MANNETKVALPEDAAQGPLDLVAAGFGRRGTGSIKELFGKHKDDPLFDEVWDQIMRDREAQREAAEREAAE
ncbi:MAG: hypothetical protein JO250_09355 [Armatimonadetes bacterium]|nr:hypothetical protein [Armatimonadota bacterium]